MMKTAVGSKMKFATTRFGLIEVDEDKLIWFVDEIPGFPEARSFVLIPHAEDSPFSWLQSVERPEVAFVVVNPWLFFGDYKPVVHEADLEKLEIKDNQEDSPVVLSILTIPSDPHKMTANLQAPVVINPRNNTAKQVILVNENYTTKHLVLPNR